MEVIMKRIVKLFCSGVAQDQAEDFVHILERYAGFVLAEIPAESLEEMARRYPLEDITDQYIIRMRERVIDTFQPRFDSAGRQHTHPAYKGEKSLSPGPHHYLVQFVGPIKEEWLNEVRKAGGLTREPHVAFSYVVCANEKTLAHIASLPYVRWVGHLPHSERIAPSVLTHAGRNAADVTSELPRTRVLPGIYTVEFFDKADMKEGLKAIEDLGFKVLEKNSKARLVFVQETKGGGKNTAKRIRDLSAVHGVRIIREQILKRTANDVATRIMGTSAVMNPTGPGLNGEGEIIAVCDTGLDNADPETIHTDFAGRITWIKSYPITSDYKYYVKNPDGDDGAADLDSGHGTHVAGSVLGSGAASAGLSGVANPIRGLAYKAKLVFQAVEQEMQWKDSANYSRYGRYLLTGIPIDLTDLFADAYQQNARIHSNSWGGGDPGEYDSQCRQLDQFVWNHKDFCILVANGNDGTDNDGDGKINPMSVSSPATAKNCISVGACENQRPEFDSKTYGLWWPDDYPVAPYRTDSMADNPDQVVAFSSRGPTRDGRVKPEVVAPGTFILSTRSTMLAGNNMAWGAFPPSRKYFHMGGTSMATPLTAGAVALIRQFLREVKRIHYPSAALMKATLIAGATRLPGYGDPGVVFDNDQGYGRVNLDAILAPSAPAQAEFLDVVEGLRTGEVYSMEIQVKSDAVPLRVVMAYSDYPGTSLVNNLNLIITASDGRRFVGNQEAGGLLTLDVKNNVEVVHIINPAAGTWKVEVVGSNIPHGPQDFALVYSADLGEMEGEMVVRANAAPNLKIPDNKPKGVSSELNIDQSGVVAGVQVSVDITHTYIGDLRVSLTTPDNTNIMLHDRQGASADDLIRIYDVNSTPGLGQLKGAPVQGKWCLNVSDHASRDTGTLRNWGLMIPLVTGNRIQKESAPFMAIPDDNPAGVIDNLTIPQIGKVQDIKVSLDITHTWIGDLIVELSAPSGHGVILHKRSGGSQDNLIKTFGIEEIPALQALLGEGVQGDWKLKVSDHAGRDVGKLNRWALDIVV